MARFDDQWLRRPMSRRRTLRTGAAGAGMAGLFLAACGGDGGQGGTTGGAARQDLVTATAQAATTKEPKPGGASSFQLSSAPPSLDPYTGGGTSFISNGLFGLSFSRLLRFKAGVPEVTPTDLTLEQDLAQNMPEQPDQLTYTFKLKPAKFHNGRNLTSEDVRYAFDRYANFPQSGVRATWTWMDRVETPDPQTVIVKAKAPYADAQLIMGGSIGAWISPKEHAESPEAATRMVGSGPFQLADYQTGVSLTFRKFPDYFDKPFPYLDEIKGFIVTDQAKRVADFSAKSVDLTWLFLPDERDQIKRNRPEAKFEETQGIGGYIMMRTDRPPFNDKRVRQALSMAINRQAIRQALTKGEGQNDQALWVALSGWARPVKDLGPAAKYWEHNPQEARQLLAAAGQPNLSFTWDHADASVYTQAYVDSATLTAAQWREVGVNARLNQLPYAQYLTNVYVQAQYEGVASAPRAAPYYVDQMLTDFYYWGPTGRARINQSYVNDPQLNQMLDRQRGQFNENERKATVRQIEEYLAEQQYMIYGSTDTRTYFWDPSITNYRPSPLFPQTHYMKMWQDSEDGITARPAGREVQ